MSITTQQRISFVLPRIELICRNRIFFSENGVELSVAHIYRPDSGKFELGFGRSVVDQPGVCTL